MQWRCQCWRGGLLFKSQVDSELFARWLLFQRRPYQELAHWAELYGSSPEDLFRIVMKEPLLYKAFNVPKINFQPVYQHRKNVLAYIAQLVDASVLEAIDKASQ